MEKQTKGAATTVAAEADSSCHGSTGHYGCCWYLNVASHQSFVQQQLQRGLGLLTLSTCVDEIPCICADGGFAGVPHAPFMEMVQQQQSMISGVYWTLCSLALLQPSAVTELPRAALLPVPHEVRMALLHKAILPCFRKRQCSGWLPAAADACSFPSVTSKMPTDAIPERGRMRRGRKGDAETSPSTQVASSGEAALPPANAGTAFTTTGRHVSCSKAVLGFSSGPAKEAVATALCTCSGLQALALLGALSSLSSEALQQLRRFLLLLQRREDGAFANTLHPSCWGSFCKDCTKTRPLGKASARMLAGEKIWEKEGDVRCTFCCLLSLKLIHAAAKAQRQTGPATSPQSSTSKPSGAARERRGSYTDEAAAVPASAEHASCLEGYREPEGISGESRAKLCHDASWEAFMSNPFAGVRVDATVSWLTSLIAADGGVGVSPGAEPHAGAAFCLVGCLSLLGKRHALGANEQRRLERWLRERQLPEGSLQGRPGKRGDSCYTFWVTAALLLMGKQPLKLLQASALADYVAAAQHPLGGISRVAALKGATADGSRGPASTSRNDKGIQETTKQESGENRSGTCSPLRLLHVGALDLTDEQMRLPDPFHTFFALAGLSLLANSGDTDMRQQDQRWRMQPQQHQEQQQKGQGWQETCKRLLKPVDPETALPLQLAENIVSFAGKNS